MTVLHPTAARALEGLLHDGMTLAVGGFGLCGNPTDLIEAVRDSGVRDLTVVSNNMGVDGKGLGLLLESDQVRHVLASYVGENALFARRFLDGDLDVEFVPQGTLAERLRAGGAGIPAFFTATGVGTPLAEGKPVQELDGRRYVLERAIVPDLALVHAYRADRFGNLVYRRTARNFNPLVAAAGRITVVEAEHLDDDPLDPDVVVTPGIYTDRLVQARERVKDIEQRTTSPVVEPTPVVEPVETTPAAPLVDPTSPVADSTSPVVEPVETTPPDAGALR
ncbi:3-oxoacid CoA-transferase, A subunit [Xylanimonas cellulosilytica DSM 15894]|uniref:3-oxoacid CoA-transferase, A subunit n=1 Tax=Xylanimonas cellulosilytica (strain DSM 15894 / JCM 12276 / CECT 5975 / KCTC 9989 / LMG 20990 / NBRC 107835 / XIL07) TaxID=446471 RepID=D1BUB0_XYLCX|nr:CoA transferase subunit A [Xylanimonas cellulosilytica]ACZ31123.1 3-oxoacid CoA-transferase, A subunit [Xylanimonas cellulosilytica DSM 15894]